MFRKTTIYKTLLLIGLSFSISGCSQMELASHYTKKAFSPWTKDSRSKGTYKVGSSYKIAGRRYYPKEDFYLVQTGIASWYGPGFHGKKTANGEIYNQYDMTAAHKTLQLPAVARVTNLENGRSTIVRINDRGPYEKGRILDLSKAAAKKLGVIGKGTAKIRLEVLPEQSRQVARAAQNGHDTSNMRYSEAPKENYRANYKKKTNTQLMHNVAYLENDAKIEYEPIGKIQFDNMPESLQRPVMTSRQVEAEAANKSNNYGNNIKEPEWSETQETSYYSDNETTTDYDVRPLSLQELSPDLEQLNKPKTGKAKNIYIQAGAFSIYDNADRLSKKLSKIVLAEISEVQSRNKPLYRVRIGPLKTMQEANSIKQDVQNSGHLDKMNIIVEN